MSMIVVHFAGIWVSQTLQIYSSGLNSPKNENKKKQKQKRKEDRVQAEKENFLALGDLMSSSNKVFIESQRFWKY